MTGPMGGLQSHLVGFTSLHVARDISGGHTFTLDRGSPPLPTPSVALRGDRKPTKVKLLLEFVVGERAQRKSDGLRGALRA